MTDKQRQRIKSDLISGKLFEVLAKANGQAHLWIKDNGVALLFSTNPLSDVNGLIVNGLPIPLCVVSRNRVADESRDVVKGFLKSLIAAEPGEANQIMIRAEQAADLPQARVKITDVGRVLTATGIDVNEVGTDGVLINGCRIDGLMEIVATIGGTASLRITLALETDVANFEKDRYYTLIYRRLTGSALGVAPVPPA